MNKTIHLLRQTLDLNPSNWEIRLHIAHLFLEHGDKHQAASLLLAHSPLPNSEENLLTYADIIRHHDTASALRVLDLVLENNKACGQAYRTKADIYRDQGMIEDANKQYNIAAVIDTSLEDPEFEAWLYQQSSQNIPTARSPIAIANSSQTTDSPSSPECVDPDDFIETDTVLDDIYESSARLIDFSHIGGMEQLKERIRMSIIYPFKNKELFKKFKKRGGGGLLFYGPPGCGKTLISRATAGECGTHFINISIHDILSKWIGESEQRIHALFTEARRKSPTVIFIDEVDALGVKRSDAGHTASLVNCLLTEMDGSHSDNDDILIIGATNTPWRVDSAFRRPGRFDHVLFVPPPDIDARMSILKILLADIPQENIDLKKLAKSTDKFSGADLRAVVDRATELVIQNIMTTGKDSKLSQTILAGAVKSTRPTTLEWIEQASNYASYANQSGLYDDLAKYIKSF